MWPRKLTTMLVLGFLEKRSYRISPDAFLFQPFRIRQSGLGCAISPPMWIHFLNVTDF